MKKSLLIIPFFVLACGAPKSTLMSFNKTVDVNIGTKGEDVENGWIITEEIEPDKENAQIREATLTDPYGVFVRMQTIRPENYKHIVNALVQSKVKVVNIQIYSYLLNLDSEAVFVSLLNKAGIDVVFRYIWIPKYKSLANISSNVSVSFDMWQKYLIKALEEFDGKQGRPHVKYISFLDEPQLYYKKSGRQQYNCADLVDFFKKGYDIVKAIRPDIRITSTTICNYDEKFFNDLFSVSLEDGTVFSDCIDILYLDYYANRNTDLYPMIKKMYDSISKLQPKVLKKPMWYCCGTSSYNRMPDDRAETLVKFIITSFFAGAEKFNLYSFVMGGGCSQTVGNADYYGIIGPSVTNSYISLLRPSSSKRAISMGDAFERVYLGCPDTYKPTTFNYRYFNLNEDILLLIKKEGFIISGKDYTFTKVIVNDGTINNGELTSSRVLYVGKHKIGAKGENALFIEPSKLQSLRASDRIVIYYDRNSADVSNSWAKLDKYKSFDSFVVLQDFLPTGSTRPHIIDVGGLHIAWWLRNGKEKVYCIYRDDFVKPQIANIEFEGVPVFYDIYSNKINMNIKSIYIGSAPIYITGVKKLKVENVFI